MLTSPQVSAPLVPKIRWAGDSSQFMEFEENNSIFRIAPQPVYVKDFEEF